MTWCFTVEAIWHQWRALRHKCLIAWCREDDSKRLGVQIQRICSRVPSEANELAPEYHWRPTDLLQSTIWGQRICSRVPSVAKEPTFPSAFVSNYLLQHTIKRLGWIFNMRMWLDLRKMPQPNPRIVNFGASKSGKSLNLITENFSVSFFAFLLLVEMNFTWK